MGLIQVLYDGGNDLSPSKHIVLLRQPLAEVLVVMLGQVYNMAYHTRRDSELLGNLLVAQLIHECHVSDPDLVVELQFGATTAPFPKSRRNVMLILS